MAKPLYVYTGTDWVPVASELESTSQYATTTYVDNKVGLVHINTTSFSAVSSQLLDGVFSSTYDNYRVLIDFTGASANHGVYFRLRSGSPAADDSSNNYFINMLGASYTPSTIYRSAGPATFLYPALVNTSYPERSSLTFDVLSPNLAVITSFHLTSMNYDATPQGFGLSGAGWINTTTQYTGLNMYPSAGNFTGKISIYGYRKS